MMNEVEIAALRTLVKSSGLLDVLMELSRVADESGDRHRMRSNAWTANKAAAVYLRTTFHTLTLAGDELFI